MRWIPLELHRSTEISEQVDTLINTYTTLQRQLAEGRASNPSQVEKALSILRRSLSDRVEDMAAFYQENDLDPRSSMVEAARLKLKRFLYALDTSNAMTKLSAKHFPVPVPREKRILKEVSGISGGKETTGGMAVKEEDPETITIRIMLTDGEYSEILARREAIRQLKLESVLHTR